MSAPVPQSYLEDASGLRGRAEKLFVPETEEEIAAILRDASQSRTPVSIAGAGTGVTGGRVPQGGWVISLERFRRIEVHTGFAITGAGVTLQELDAAARRTGQFFPPDPTEMSASVGGVIACNASGSRSFGYGDTRRYLRRLRVVHADGRIAEYRRGDAIDFQVPAISIPRATKHAAGYRLAPGMSWIDLIAGSEGTLAVVTEAELGLLPAPVSLFSGVVFFASDAEALEAVDAWRSVEKLRMLEYLDQHSLALLRSRYPEMPPNAQAALLMEQETGEEEADAWLERLEEHNADAEGSWFALSNPDRERFRRFRHALPEAVNEIVRRRGQRKLNSDCAVPVSRSREMLDFYRQRLEKEFPGQYVIFGHIGDAHLHPNLLVETEEQAARGQALMVEFARKAVALGGTVGAEHGLGKRKAHLLAIQYSPEEIEAMKAVKRRLDPHWILSPANLFPNA